MIANLDNTGRLTLDKSIKLKPYEPREHIPITLMSDNEIIHYAGGHLIIDTELYANFFLILMKNVATGNLIKFTLDNLNTRMLSWIMHSYTTIGFNYWKYDLPVIWAAYKYQDIAKIKEVSDAVIFQNMWPSGLQKEFDFKIWPTQFIDLIEICPGQHSLKLYMGRLHSQRIQDLPFKPGSTLTDEQKEVVTDYCHNDIVGTQELYLFNEDRIQLREELGRDYGIELRSKSDAQMAEAMVAKEIYKKTGNWPKKADLNKEYTFKYQPPDYIKFDTSQLQKLFADVCNTEFKVRYGELYKPELFKNYYVALNNFRCKFGIGGLHSCEETVAYKANDDYLIIDRDVSSYYPRIITSLKLYPDHIGPVFLEVFEKMMDDRLYAKQHKLFAKDKGLKIATNGISGKFQSEYSIVFSPKCYIQMTLTGQLSILMLAEMLYSQGIQVISANTDGLVIFCQKNDYDRLLYWVDYWEKLTTFKTEETQYKAYYARDCNAYFALKLDNSIKMKGPYSEVGSQTGTKLDNNPITLICSDAICKLISDNIPIEKTIRECRDITRFLIVRNVKGGAHKNGTYLGRVVRWIYGKNEHGTIDYMSSGNKVADSDGAIAIMDLPNEFPSNIDYEKYIERTLGMLFDIGYYQRAKQLTFFNASIAINMTAVIKATTIPKPMLGS